jgi:hypothetical protein
VVKIVASWIAGAWALRSRKSGIETDACGSPISGYLFQMKTSRVASGYGSGRRSAW